MSSPLISIVVPAYNREKIVGPTIESVLAQTQRDWELVIFDDGSKDGTAAAAQRYADADPRIRVLSGPNGGVASARNRGFAATNPQSEFVIFLDSDDLWFPDTLEALLSILHAHPEYVSVYGLAQCIDIEGHRPPGDDLEQQMRNRVEYRGNDLIPLRPDEPTTFAGLIYHNWVVTAGIHLMRRSILEQVGAFDPKTNPADDWDLVLRTSRYGDIGFAERLVLQWRRHPETLTGTSPRWKAAYFKVRRNTLLDPRNTAKQTRLAKLGYTAARKEMLSDSLRHFTRGELAGGGRDFLKAMELNVRYFSALAPMVVHNLRSRRSSS